MKVLQDLYHQPQTLYPIDPLKEPLKVTLIDPFKGTSPGSKSELEQVARVASFGGASAVVWLAIL